MPRVIFFAAARNNISMEKRIYAFALLACCLRLPVFAESAMSGGGHVGAELSVPGASRGAIPAIKLRLGFPAEFSPDFAEAFPDAVRGGLRLSWGGRANVYAGNLSLSGTVSVLRNPDFSLSLFPLGNSGFSAAGIAVGLPSYSDSAPPLALAVSASAGRATLQLAATEEDLYTAAVTVPVLSGRLSVTSTTVAGLYFLPPVLPDGGDAWFSKDLPYGGGWYFAGAEEIRIRGRRFRAQLMAGAFASPFGEVDFWTRLRAVYRAGVLSVDGGIYAGDSGIVSANAGRIRSTVQCFATPQLRFVLPGKGGSFVRFGVNFAADGRNTNGMAPVFLAAGKIRFGAEMSTPAVRLRLYAGRYGIPIYGDAPTAASAAEKKYTADAELLLREPLFRDAFTFMLALGAAAYPSGGAFLGKADVSASFSAEPAGKPARSLFSFVPAVTIKTTAAFRSHEFHSGRTEAATSWAWRARLVTLRAKIAAEWKYPAE